MSRHVFEQTRSITNRLVESSDKDGKPTMLLLPKVNEHRKRVPATQEDQQMVLRAAEKRLRRAHRNLALRTGR